jgi:signal recognition particle receptor subunit beta
MQQQSQAFTQEPLTPPSTHTSQIKYLYPLVLHPTIPLKSNRYRSDNDTSVVNLAVTGTPYKLLDTPGHGKLRSTAALTPSTISDPNLYGVIFQVDASALDSAAYLTDVATYLHDTLLALLKRRKSKTLKKDARTRNIPVLIAANKQDLFTALPAGSVREKIEAEIQRIRESKRRGVVGVDAREDDVGDEDEEVLGGSDQKFSFKALDDEEGADLRVEVIGGSVGGDEAGKGVKSWELWIGQCL